MQYKKILITGGAGFVGSNLAVRYKQDYSGTEVIALDNLKRRGSELNITRLKEKGIKFIHGDIRNYEDIDSVGEAGLVIECSAECSVLASYHNSPKYVIDTNLLGMANCLEYARKYKSDFIFLSTSRVYPVKKLNSLHLIEKESRFELSLEQNLIGVSEKGISEEFPLDGVRSFYGTSKLAAELILQEYIEGYGLKGIINRCGVIAGPWQMGKVDQGVVTLWTARHIYGGKLSYIGFGGKQVRDVLHVDDLYELIKLQLQKIDIHNGQIYNVGGGINNSLSLLEMTALCEKTVKNKINIDFVPETREADIPYYVTDFSKINKLTGWLPKIDVRKIVEDITEWILENKKTLQRIF